MTTEHVTVAVSAHRGGGESAPLGTMAAYEHALASGVEYVEFDVQRTRDGELVVFHDATIGPGGPAPWQVTRPEMSRLLGYDVVAVRELLPAIRGRARAHIDVKRPGYEADVIALATAELDPAEFVVTGDDRVVAAAKRHDPGVYTAVSIGQSARDIPPSRLIRTRWSELYPFDRLAACGADAVAIHHRLARIGVLRACARRGVDVLVWTVNSDRMIRAFVHDPRVRILITDRPGYALGVRGAPAR